MSKHLIPITDDKGQELVDPDQNYEPNPGSLVMTDGQWGTAFQRHFSDGLWYSTVTGRRVGFTWDDLLCERNLVLVYDAPVRPEPADRPGAPYQQRLTEVLPR